MHYIYDYLILSAFFLAIIVFRFYSQYQFPSIRNRIFSVILITSVIVIILDIASGLAIERPGLPPWLTYIVCLLYYISQVVFPYLLVIYILSLTELKMWFKPQRAIFILLPAAITMLILLTNPLTNVIFVVNPITGQARGALFSLIYINSFVYFIYSFVFLIYYRRLLQSEEFKALMCFMSIICGVVILQFLFPQYLLVSAAIVVALTILYIIMQKPEDMIDHVSSAFNQRAFDLFIHSHIRNGKSYSLIVVEPLYMRRMNRLFGIRFGNDTLKAVSNVMKKADPKGWVFRSIGNVFLLACSNSVMQKQAYETLSNIFNSDIVINEKPIAMTITLLSIPNTAFIRTVDALNECLENVLNTIPRGSHCILDSENLLAESRRDMVQEALEKAVHNNELKTYIQPIYATASGKFETAEILCRFPHKTLGMIPPTEFINIAEKNGLIYSVDEQMIRNLCKILNDKPDFLHTGLGSIEVNVTPIEFVDLRFFKHIKEILHEYNIDPSFIWFEVTESGIDADFETVSSIMHQLSEQGFKFVLDDYGKGYSNIERIINLPFSIIKIDLSLLHASMMDERKKLVLHRTIQMFHDLHIRTVVEGIETVEQAKAMIEQGVDYLQGYYYARPMPIEDFSSFCQHNQPDSNCTASS